MERNGGGVRVWGALFFCRAPSHQSGSKGERQPHSGGISPRMHHHAAAGIRSKWELVHCGPAARYKTLTLTHGDQRLLGLEAREVTPACRREVERFSPAGTFFSSSFISGTADCLLDVEIFVNESYRRLRWVRGRWWFA